MIWIAPRGVAALVAAAVLAFALAHVEPWPLAGAIALLLVVVLAGLDALALRSRLDVEREEPPRLALARPAFLSPASAGRRNRSGDLPEHHPPAAGGAYSGLVELSRYPLYLYSINSMS